MIRRSLGAALWAVAGLLACFLGALQGMIGTGTGRRLLARTAARAVTAAIDGRITLRGASGPLLTGLTLTDVQVFDPESTLVAELPRVVVSYNPFDLAAGRVVLLSAALDRPSINIVQHRNGRLDIEELLRLGRPDSGPHKPATLILLRNVRIDGGTVALRTRDATTPATSGLEFEDAGVDGRRRVRRFDHLEARFASLLLSSPRQPGIHASVRRLAFAATDPLVTVRDLAGTIAIVGDSLDADLTRLTLPASSLKMKGQVRWPHDTLRYALEVRADSTRLGDVRFVAPWLPPAAVLHGNVGVHSHGARVIEVAIDPLTLTDGRGRLTGRVTAVSAADSGLVALRNTDLTAENLSLDVARGLVDTLPLAGWLTGHTTADGPTSDLTVGLDWTFADSLVPGAPLSRLTGEGRVALGKSVRFAPLTVTHAALDLGTIRGVIPGLPLRGTLAAYGTLTGTFADPQFAGILRQQDGDRPASTVHGTLRLDRRSDTLGVFVHVTADTLSFDGLARAFPNSRLTGSVSGPVQLDGSLADLGVHVALTGAGDAGTVGVDGRVTWLPARRAARDLRMTARDVDLSRWWPGLPATRLNATASASLGADSGATATGTAAATLAPSVFAGTVLDSGTVGVRLADGRMAIDSLRLAIPGVAIAGSGGLGLAAPERAQASLDVAADSLDALDSLATWLAGPADSAAAGQALRGTARALVVLDGALDSMSVDARVNGDALRWRGWMIPSARGHVRIDPRASGTLALDVSADSIAHGRLGFGDASAAAVGRRDSFAWFARSRVGDLGDFLAGGRLARRGDSLAVALDSLALLLPNGVWLQDSASRVLLADSVVRGELHLARAGGGGRLVLDADLPVAGPDRAHVALTGFPMAGIYSLLEYDTLGVAGTIDATADLSGTRRAPIASGQFAVQDAAFGDFHAPAVAGRFTYADRRLDAAAQVTRDSRKILDVTAHLPLDLALTAVAQRQVPDTLAVRVVADHADLSVLEALTPTLQHVAGSASMDVGITGTWDEPSLRGTVAIADGAVTLPTLQVRYDDVNGRLALSGDTIRVDTLDLRSGSGRATVGGFVRLARLTKPVLGLAIHADQFKALDIRDYLTLTASGDLRLTGPVIGATLTGSGTVPDGVLHFADLLNKRIVNFDEPWAASLIDTSLAQVIRNQELGPEFESVFFDSLNVKDLALAMGSDVWLRSNEANIQMTGAVRVNKSHNVYTVTGTLQALHGTYRLVVPPISRDFQVTEGTVRYFGTPDLDAELNIEAKHAITSPDTLPINVTARITGTLLVPKLTLSVDERPDLSQTEVISYLLFGKSSVALSGGGLGGQSAVLRNAVASLVSGELERTLVSDLGVPLDYVQINPSDSLTGFEAGVQLSRKTFLVVNGGVCQGRSSTNTLGVSLQFRLNQEWRTEASFEPVQSCLDAQRSQETNLQALRQLGLDLFWERRF